MKSLLSFVTFVLMSISSLAVAEIQFPEITVDNLNGQSQSFPQGLPANPTIVFIAYKQNQQEDLQAWIEALGLQESGGQAWVEFPVIGRGGALMRSFIDNGMRSGITSDALRNRVFTVYSSRGAFNQSLGISGSQQVYVALVGRDGAIYTLIEGQVTSEKVSQLRAAFP